MELYLHSVSRPPTTTSPSPSTPCNGVIDRGLCYDRLCWPVRGRSRLQKTLKLKCESRPGHGCDRVGKRVQCVEKRITNTTTRVPPLSSSTSSSTVTVGPTVVAHCEDQTGGDNKDGSLKCPKHFRIH